jgi:outer membrane protein assembly factor BamB
VGSDDGYLYGLDCESGALVWRYRTGGAIAAGPAVADGKLYAGSIDRRLHAFSLEAE